MVCLLFILDCIHAASRLPVAMSVMVLCVPYRAVKKSVFPGKIGNVLSLNTSAPPIVCSKIQR